MARHLSSIDKRYRWTLKSVRDHVKFFCRCLRKALKTVYGTISFDLNPTDDELLILSRMVGGVVKKTIPEADSALMLYACMTIAWFYYIVDGYDIGLSMLAETMGVDPDLFSELCVQLALSSSDLLLSCFL